MKTIMVVDDEPIVLNLVSLILEKRGHTILRAADGEEALALHAAHGPLDLLVTDVRLGRMDGFKLSQLMRYDQPGLKVLFISGYISDASNLLAERKIPAYGFFLHKPFQPAQLCEMISVMLQTGTAQPAIP